MRSLNEHLEELKEGFGMGTAGDQMFTAFLMHSATKKKIDNSIPGVSPKEITKLENIVEGSLPKDYKGYLAKYGFMSLKGRDIFGLGDKKFNTLSETKKLQKDFKLAKNFVALENVGTDGMYVVLNTKDGAVYEWTPQGHSKKVYPSFSKFIEKDFK